jgi:hypothetical protein
MYSGTSSPSIAPKVLCGSRLRRPFGAPTHGADGLQAWAKVSGRDACDLLLRGVHVPIYMIVVYAKSEKVHFTPAEKKEAAKSVAQAQRTARARLAKPTRLHVVQGRRRR